MTTNRAQLGRAVGAVALTAAMALIWQSEWQLALAVGWPPYIAWLAPVALDAYVLAAVLHHRDVGVAMTVSATSVFISHAVYATPNIWASNEVGEGHLVWWAAALFSAVPLLVAWRVHHLVADPVPAKPVKAARKAEPVVPVTVPKPVIGADPSPDPQKSPVASVTPDGPTRAQIAQTLADRRRLGDPLPTPSAVRKEWPHVKEATSRRIVDDVREMVEAAP